MVSLFGVWGWEGKGMGMGADVWCRLRAESLEEIGRAVRRKGSAACSELCLRFHSVRGDVRCEM